MSALPFIVVGVAVLLAVGVISEPRRVRLAEEAHRALEALPPDAPVVRCAFKARTPWRIYVSYPLGGMYVARDVLIFMSSVGGTTPKSRRSIRVLRADTRAIVDKGKGFVFHKFVIKSRPYAVIVYLHDDDVRSAGGLWEQLGWVPRDDG